MADARDDDGGDEGGADERDSYAQAVHLARRGRFDQAGLMLARATAERACSQAQAHDLAARMLAQQGFLLDADASWRKAQQSDPANPAFAEARRALRAVPHPRWRRLAMTGPLAAGAAAAVLTVWLVLGAVADRSERLERELLAAVGALDATLARASERIAASELRLRGDMQGFARADDVARLSSEIAQLTRLVDRLSEAAHAAARESRDALDRLARQPAGAVAGDGEVK